MHRTRIPIFIPLIVLLLVTQACLIPVPNSRLFNNLDRFLCGNLLGNEWVETADGGECVPAQESEDNQAPDLSDDPVQEGEPQGSQEPESADPQSCNAYYEVRLLQIGPEKTETSSETKCKYSLEFTNASDQQIWIFLHESNQFMNGEGEEKWDNYLNLSPGESYQVHSDYTVRKHDLAVSAHILDKIAAIYATEECTNTFKNNAKVKNIIAAETPQLCGP